MIRPGGVIRVTESEVVECSSPALKRLTQLVLDTVYRAGHFFTPARNGVTSELTRLLHRYGLQHVQTRVHTLEYRAGTTEGHLFYEDMRRVFRTVVPFLQKWSRVPDDYEVIYQQALSEMQQPDFVATWKLLTAWGIAP